TLMTVAPMSASSMVAYGPARTREKSATTMPSRTPVDVELVARLMLLSSACRQLLRKIDAGMTSMDGDLGNDAVQCCWRLTRWLPCMTSQEPHRTRLWASMPRDCLSKSDRFHRRPVL